MRLLAQSATIRLEVLDLALDDVDVVVELLLGRGLRKDVVGGSTESDGAEGDAVGWKSSQ